MKAQAIRIENVFLECPKPIFDGANGGEPAKSETYRRLEFVCWFGLIAQPLEVLLVVVPPPGGGVWGLVWPQGGM